jgi:hypothetical protein
MKGLLEIGDASYVTDTLRAQSLDIIQETSVQQLQLSRSMFVRKSITQTSAPSQVKATGTALRQTSICMVPAAC